MNTFFADNDQVDQAFQNYLLENMMKFHMNALKNEYGFTPSHPTQEMQLPYFPMETASLSIPEPQNVGFGSCQSFVDMNLQNSQSTQPRDTNLALLEQVALSLLTC